MCLPECNIPFFDRPLSFPTLLIPLSLVFSISRYTSGKTSVLQQHVTSLQCKISILFFAFSWFCCQKIAPEKCWTFEKLTSSQDYLKPRFTLKQTFKNECMLQVIVEVEGH